MKKFWKWKNQAETEERTLFLDGVIAAESWFDDDVTPKLFKDELISGAGNITVWINSPGGDCIAAAQIYNMLTEYKGKVTVFIDGLAASAASVIAMAGDEVVMSPVSNIMIHNPSTVVCGDCSELERAIRMLNTVKESIINAYEIRTGLSRIKLSHLMDSEKWMEANEAVELGFADRIKACKPSNDSFKYILADVYNTQTAMNKILYNKICNKYNSKNTLMAKQAEIKPIEKQEHRVSNIMERLNCIKKHI